MAEDESDELYVNDDELTQSRLFRLAEEASQNPNINPEQQRNFLLNNYFRAARSNYYLSEPRPIHSIFTKLRLERLDGLGKDRLGSLEKQASRVEDACIGSRRNFGS